MNPLAAYLLSVMKREESTTTRAFRQSEDALREMGYWCMSRPSGFTREQMPRTAIESEYLLLEEFLTYTSPADGVVEGFDTIIEVYADPRLADLEPR